MRTHLFRITGALVALTICHWGIFVRPRRQPELVADPSAELSFEAAARLQDRIATLIRARKFQEALPLSERILKEFPHNPVYLRRTAELHDQLGNYAAEVQLWEAFMRVSPTPGEACPDLGYAYQKLGRGGDAIGAFERFVELQPKNPEFLYFLARAYERGKQYRKAMATYQRTCTFSGDDPDPIVGWARMEVFNGAPAQALRRLQPVLARNPDNVDALLVEGMALRQQGAYDRARPALERGLRLSPGYADFLLVLAGISEAQDRPREALAWYDRYLALAPEQTEVRARRARVAQRVAK